MVIFYRFYFTFSEIQYHLRICNAWQKCFKQKDIWDAGHRQRHYNWLLFLFWQFCQPVYVAISSLSSIQILFNFERNYISMKANLRNLRTLHVKQFITHQNELYHENSLLVFLKSRKTICCHWCWNIFDRLLNFSTTDWSNFLTSYHFRNFKRYFMAPVHPSNSYKSSGTPEDQVRYQSISTS